MKLKLYTLRDNASIPYDYKKIDWISFQKYIHSKVGEKFLDVLDDVRLMFGIEDMSKLNAIAKGINEISGSYVFGTIAENDFLRTLENYGDNAPYIYSFLINKFPADNFSAEPYETQDPLTQETIDNLSKYNEIPQPIEPSEELISLVNTGIYVRPYQGEDTDVKQEVAVDSNEPIPIPDVYIMQSKQPYAPPIVDYSNETPISIGIDLPDINEPTPVNVSNDTPISVGTEIPDINKLIPVNDQNNEPIGVWTDIPDNEIPLVYWRPVDTSEKNTTIGSLLVSKTTVQLLRKLLNPNGLERTLNNLGFPVDLQPILEKYLAQLSETSSIKNEILTWIKNNYTYFIYGDIDAVTKSLNNYLLLDPYVISLFGYPIEIYTDPYHIRQYFLYGAAALIGYIMLRKLL